MRILSMSVVNGHADRLEHSKRTLSTEDRFSQEKKSDNFAAIFFVRSQLDIPCIRRLKVKLVEPIVLDTVHV